MDSNVIIKVDRVMKKYKVSESNSKKGFFNSFKRKKVIKVAVKNISLNIKKGSIVALLGKNGSGKSTLIKMMTGILYPDSGQIIVDGLLPYNDRKKLALKMGVVLGAHGQLYWNLPAIDTFNFMRSMYKIPEKEFEKRLKLYLKMLSLKDVYKKPVRTMSLGEQMKCNFVASMLHNPKIVFLDEPTIGVDLPSKSALKEAILTAREKLGTTFLLTTHIVEDIEIADHVIVINKGRKEFDGTKKKLEHIFGDNRIVELYSTNIAQINLMHYGRVISKTNNMAKLEVRPSMLKSKEFLKILNSKHVFDYRVSEPHLSYVLSKLYKSFDKKGERDG
ncbi:MAG: ATP-binding cassette domain-containing protein [Candidatus Marsarchaeota archaeon]|nr:ATP-binding cassette domain-containing protein [Candidatus Marsarchaeota archaeon]